MEVPREFYKSHMNELVRFTNAEKVEDVVFMAFMTGQKQTTIQFKPEEFDLSSVLNVLQELQPYYYKIKWGDEEKNWCYLRRSRKDKCLKFTQRHKAMDRQKIKEQPWARVVDENDITIDEYGPSYRYGMWKGQEVDVYKVWTDRDLPFLNHAMKAYRRLEGMNLTYEILGHVVDGDGTIVGIMTEPMKGRPLELHDESLVFDSLKRLIDIGWILDFPWSMLVTDKGELRISAMHNVVELPKNAEERQKKISDVEKFFREHVFTRFKSPSERFGGSITRAKLCIPVQVLVPQANPEKILKGSNDWVVEPFKWRYPTEILKLSRRPQRLLEADENDDSRSGGGDRSRSAKKHRDPFYSKQKRLPRSSGEAPRRCLSIPAEVSPLVPPEDTENFLPRCSSLPSPDMGGVPSWMQSHGDWLQLAMAPMRVEIVGPDMTW